MADGNRVYPVSEAFMHHSTGPEFVNSGDLEVQDWFDSVGKSRGYENGALRSYHNHPNRAKETYTMAHFALRRYTADGNKYGWRLTPLMQDVWNNVAWHCGNWPHNQKSIGIETCGNYLNALLDDKALMLVADSFRGQDAALGGGFMMWVHKWVYATACPGRIAEQIDKIVDMMNNPAKWNAALWPAPAPPPPPPPPEQPEWVRNGENITKQRMYSLPGASLINITNGQVVSGPYPANTTFDLTRKTVAGGQKYYITEYSAGKNIWNGLKAEFLTLEPPKPPEPTPVPTPTPTPVPVPTPTPTADPVKVKRMIDGIQAVIKDYEGGK